MSELTLESLRSELESLRAEIAELRALLKPNPNAQMEEHVVPILAAAIAAFLGKRATFRVIRRHPVQQDGWRLQGRVAIQGARQPR
jgi:hypothetical protein